jgi:hypothetical protein
MAKKGELDPNASADSKRQRKYNSSDKQKKRRAERNASRRKMEKAGKVKKGDNRDVDHKNHKTSDKSNGNLRVQSRSKNRANNLGTGGRKKKGK